MNVPGCVGHMRLDESVTLTYVRLDALAPDDVAELRRLLAPNELRAADRLRRSDHAIQRVAGRAAARIGLSTYARIEPAAWEFVTDALGKPSVQPEQAGRDLWFSIAHTSGLAVCALSDTGPVGADCEHPAPRELMPQLARRMFAPDELAAWTALPFSRRTPAFYGAWTAKEAVAKAVGLGIRLGMPGIIAVCDDEYAVLGREGATWRILRPAVSPDHCVAVARPTCADGVPSSPRP